MIKDGLIEEIRDSVGGVSEKSVWSYVTFILEEMASTLVRGESVKITNFGTFETREKRARVGRNPKTMEEAEISQRRVVRFKASRSVTKLLNPEE